MCLVAWSERRLILKAENFTHAGDVAIRKERKG